MTIIGTAVRGMVAATLLLSAVDAGAQQATTVRLDPPDLTRGRPFMETLSVKASATEWSDRDLSPRDLSDLLWAANGLNRPKERKYTASSAMNAHDVDLYLFMKDGIYLYDYDNHAIARLADGDFRSAIAGTPPPRPADAPGAPQPPRPAPSNPPLVIVLVSDTSRFRVGTPELKAEWGAIDTGIVSQNISLFCAATGLATRPKASMDRGRIRELLKLKDAQLVLLNHPVGYAK